MGMLDTNLYKTMLETERDEILNDLKGVAVQDSITGEFNPVSDTSITEADELDLDNRNEDYETNSALSDTLGLRLKEVELALYKIENGTYGTCEVSGEPIEEERLQVNPAARTCSAHMNS